MDQLTLSSLYEICLQDIWSVEHQLIKALPSMASGVTSDRLSEAIDIHLVETQQHLNRVEAIMEDLGIEKQGLCCSAMKEFIDEAESFMDNISNAAVMDAAVIVSLQKMEHYEIAAYSGAARLAAFLGYEDQSIALQVTIEEEYNFDDLLTEIAEDTSSLMCHE